MAYETAKPANDGFLADFPPEMREQLRSVIQDAIVNSGLLQGLSPGNSQGQIPVSNGTVCTGLNAEKVGGKLPSAFADSGHGHNVATGSSNGFMVNTDKTKLDGIAAGAKVNQMAFSNVLVGNTTIQADSETDTLEMVAGANITLTPDATNDRVTIAVSGKVGSAAQADNATTASSATTAGTCTGNSATATVTNFVFSPDGDRGNSVLPTTNPRTVKFAFGNGSVLGGSIGNYVGLMTYSPWDGTSASTGDCSYQMAFGSTVANGGVPRLAIRNGINSTWNAWNEFITSANIAGQSVKCATSAGTATNSEYVGNDSSYMRFHWNGQGGQPAWLWGGNEAGNMYVWNPSNFSVNYANSAGIAKAASAVAWGNISGKPDTINTLIKQYTVPSNCAEIVLNGFDLTNGEVTVVIEADRMGYNGNGTWSLFAVPKELGRSNVTTNGHHYVGTHGSGARNSYGAAPICNMANVNVSGNTFPVDYCYYRSVIKMKFILGNYVAIHAESFDWSWGVSHNYWISRVTVPTVTGIQLYAVATNNATGDGSSDSNLCVGISAGTIFKVYQ